MTTSEEICPVSSQSGSRKHPLKRAGIAALWTLGIILSVWLLILFGTWLVLQRAKSLAHEAGLVTDYRELYPEPVPDEENAAELLDELYVALDAINTDILANYACTWDQYGRTPNSLDKRESYDLAVLPSDRRASLLALLKTPDYQQVYSILYRMAERPYFDTKLDFSLGENTPLPHLSKMRSLARLLFLRSWLLADVGDFEGAMDDLLCAMTIARFLYSEPILISHLVAYVMESGAVNTFHVIHTHCGMAAWPTEQLERLSAALDPTKCQTVFPEAIKGEAVVCTTGLRRLILQKQAPVEKSQSLIAKGWYLMWQRILYYPLLQLQQASLLDYLRFARIESRHDAVHAVVVGFKMKIPEIYEESSMIINVLSKAPYKMWRHKMELAVARSALDIELYARTHGDYPPLDRINVAVALPLDTFAAPRTLKYDKQADGFMIYSFWDDFKDDGGMPLGQDMRGDLVVTVRQTPAASEGSTP